MRSINKREKFDLHFLAALASKYWQPAAIWGLSITAIAFAITFGDFLPFWIKFIVGVAGFAAWSFIGTYWSP